MKKKIILTLAGAAVVLVALAAIWKNSFGKKDASFTFETATVKRGKISNTVTATGTLEAIETVDVGTQVSGVINKLYVDFNSEVKKGQLLAEIDKRPLQSQLDQSKANLDAAVAELNFQKATYDRNKALFEKKLISQADYDQVVFNYETSKANLMNARSTYERNKINLDYATISSPIDGVVLNRAVQQGQTVAASFNTPTLFSIANDLTRMKVEASVDEADIGQVKNGQRVEFTVDAYPDLKFPGTITQVRLQPVITSNVVTYTVIIDAPNPDKKLMPGMTATSTIFVQEADDNLLIPINAAKFKPDSLMVRAYLEARGVRNGNKTTSAKGGETGYPRTEGGNSFLNRMNADPNRIRVWVKKENRIYPVHVEINISDGINYGIKSGLNEGDSVILTMKQSSSGTKLKSTGQARSPFMPTPPRRGR